MRDILYRGKAKDSGEWIESDSILQFEEHPLKKCRVIELFQARGGWVEVIPETVGQYTGLVDKNCNKIFEGDIVKYGETIHKVVFEQRNNTAYFGLVYSPLETLAFGNYQDLRQIETIGNIHDNPEFLKGGG